ncbi:DMT family transporter [Desulfovibrio sp. OttesenSCG-928-C06]|nr:DMT family transporter [Desulfovibrio sp. OttesenSCG-928-C06]
MKLFQDRNSFIGASFAIIATIIWAGNSVAGRGLAHAIPPMTFVAGRMIVALIVVLPIAWKPLRNEWGIIRKHLPFYALCGLTGMFGINVLIYIAGRYVPALNLSIGSITTPLFVIIISRFVYGERISWLRLLGLAIVLSGVLTLLCGGDLAVLLSLSFSIGDLLMLVGAFCFAVYSLLVRKAPAGVSSSSFLALFFLFTLLFSLTGSAVEFGILGMEIHPSPVLLGGVLYLGLGASLIAYALWNQAIARIGASQTSLFYYLLPLFSGLEASALLGEPVLPVHLVSGGLILGGLILANKKS